MRLPRSAGALAKPFSATGLENRLVKVLFTFSRPMRSCGRLGPAKDGITVDKSSSTVCE